MIELLLRLDLRYARVLLGLFEELLVLGVLLLARD